MLYAMINSMSEIKPPEDIAEIIAAVTNRDPDVSTVDALAAIVAKDYNLLGTAQSQAVHEPVADQHYGDRHLGHEVYVEDPGIPVLQATWSGKIAIMGAVFGDINVPQQRQQLGNPLTDGPHRYGWFGLLPEVIQEKLDLPLGDLGYVQESIALQADLELLHAVRRQHDTIVGGVDVLAWNESYYFLTGAQDPGEIRSVTRPGIVLTRQAQTTVATLPIYGSDLWETGIVPTTDPTRY